MYWNLIINFDWNIIEIEIAKYKHSTELSCNITTLPVGLSDTQIGVCRVYVFMYGLWRLSRVEVHTSDIFNGGNFSSIWYNPFLNHYHLPVTTKIICF